MGVLEEEVVVGQEGVGCLGEGEQEGVEMPVGHLDIAAFQFD